jgi:hypothetical protein
MAAAATATATAVFDPEPALPVLAPATEANWATHFLAQATELDATGFPLRGIVGLGFHCFTDISLLKRSVRFFLACDTIDATHDRLGLVLPDGPLVEYRADLLVQVFDDFQPGRIVAFKKGDSVVAIARITSDYRYEPAHEATTGCPHRWNYEIIQKFAVPIPMPPFEVNPEYNENLYNRAWDNSDYPVHPASHHSK